MGQIPGPRHPADVGRRHGFPVAASGGGGATRTGGARGVRLHVADGGSDAGGGGLFARAGWLCGKAGVDRVVSRAGAGVEHRVPGVCGAGGGDIDVHAGVSAVFKRARQHGAAADIRAVEAGGRAMGFRLAGAGGRGDCGHAGVFAVQSAQPGGAGLDGGGAAAGSGFLQAAQSGAGVGRNSLRPGAGRADRGETHGHGDVGAGRGGADGDADGAKQDLQRARPGVRVWGDCRPGTAGGFPAGRAGAGHGDQRVRLCGDRGGVPARRAVAAGAAGVFARE